MQYKSRRKHLSRNMSCTFTQKKMPGTKIGYLNYCLPEGFVSRGALNQAKKLDNNRRATKYW
jgi:hypothetical protein